MARTVGIILLLIFANIAYGSVPVAGNKVLQYDKEIARLTAEISKLETSLNAQNNRYLGVVAKERQIEGQLLELRQKLKVRNDKLAKLQAEAKRILAGLLVNSMGNTQDAAALLSHKLMIQALKERLARLQEEISENSGIYAQTEDLEQRFAKYRQLEQELLTLLTELEERKRNVAEDYLRQMEQREQMQLKLTESAKVPLSEKNGRFALPMDNYANMKMGTTRISFKFVGTQPVLCVDKGKVLYAGSIGAYGKAVILDHGDQLMSVVSGQFRPKVKKGDVLLKGDILGYTNVLGNTTGNIDFEVRKNQQALNIAQLMNK